MKIKLDPGAYMPERAHKTDAGLDLKSPHDVFIMPGGNATINTGVHIQLPAGTVGMLKSKSGLNVKYCLVGEGVIDEGYSGSIVVKLYNHGNVGYWVRKGDKVIQLVIVPYVAPNLEVVDELEESERGCNGFGSTGR